MFENLSFFLWPEMKFSYMSVATDFYKHFIFMRKNTKNIFACTGHSVPFVYEPLKILADMLNYGYGSCCLSCCPLVHICAFAKKKFCTSAFLHLYLAGSNVIFYWIRETSLLSECLAHKLSPRTKTHIISWWHLTIAICLSVLLIWHTTPLWCPQ